METLLFFLLASQNRFGWSSPTRAIFVCPGAGQHIPGVSRFWWIVLVVLLGKGAARRCHRGRVLSWPWGAAHDLAARAWVSGSCTHLVQVRTETSGKGKILEVVAIMLLL